MNIARSFFNPSKKKTITLAFFCFLSIASYSQNLGTIKGKVSDGIHPIEFADVLLSTIADSSKAVHYALTDSIGLFTLDKITRGEYWMQIRMIGYKPLMKKIIVSQETLEQNLGSIVLPEDATMLSQVTVTGQRKIIQKTSEGYIVNAASNIVQIGGTAADLFRNIPTIAVDADGGITLRGKTPLILINGRNSAITSLDQIAASSIESVEIITTPSAKYDAYAESGIVNIILKKNRSDGINGAFAAGFGKGSYGRMNSTAMLNYKKGKWNTGLAYDNRFAIRTKTIEKQRTNLDLPDDYQLIQNRNDSIFQQLQNLKFNLDFMPNNKNILSFEAIGNIRGEDNFESLNTTTNTQLNIITSSKNRFSKEIRRTKVAEFALNYNRKYDDSRKTLFASLSTSVERGRENTDITTHLLNENKQFTDDEPFLERTHNYEDGYRTNAVVDYAFPVSSRAIIETGYKGLYRSLDADFEASDKINGVYVINTSTSNIFHFSEQIHAAYVQYNAVIGSEDNTKWKYNIGLRAEQVFTNGDTQDNTTQFENQYIKFFPTANIIYYPKSDEFLKLGYAKRIRYPGSGQLNPFIDITDAMNQHGGNPYLKPEIIHSFEFVYNKDFANYSLSSTLFYRHSLNTIKNYSTLYPNGVILLKPGNFGVSYTGGIENVITAQPSKFYNMNLSFSLFRQHIDGTNIAGDIANDAFSWYGKLINNIIFWHDSKLQIIGNYNSAVATPQGKTIAVYNIDLGFQKRLGNSNARIGLVVTDVFNMLKSGDNQKTPVYTSLNRSKSDTRAIMFMFAYTFNSTFKEKMLENKFSTEY